MFTVSTTFRLSRGLVLVTETRIQKLDTDSETRIEKPPKCQKLVVRKYGNEIQKLERGFRNHRNEIPRLTRNDA